MYDLIGRDSTVVEKIQDFNFLDPATQLIEVAQRAAEIDSSGELVVCFSNQQTLVPFALLREIVEVYTLPTENGTPCSNIARS